MVEIKLIYVESPCSVSDIWNLQHRSNNLISIESSIMIPRNFYWSAAPIVPPFLESISNTDDNLEIGNSECHPDLQHFDDSFDSLLIKQNEHQEPLQLNNIELSNLVNIDEFLSI